MSSKNMVNRGGFKDFNKGGSYCKKNEFRTFPTFEVKNNDNYDGISSTLSDLPDHRRYKLVSEGGLWNFGIIPYTIDIQDDELKSMVQSAIKQYNDTVKNVIWVNYQLLYIYLLQSCKPVTDTSSSLRIFAIFSSSSIKFTRDDTNCPRSYVGCLRVMNQKIFLCKHWPSSSTKIKIGNILHEMTHAIGFGHTHQRWDRKKYLILNKPAKEDQSYATNYKNKSKYTIGKYDFKSIMHYATGEFNQMKCKNPKNDIFTGNRKKFSENDIEIINSLYHYEAERRRNFGFSL